MTARRGEADDRFVDTAMRWLRTVLVPPVLDRTLVLPDGAAVAEPDVVVPDLGLGTANVADGSEDAAVRRARQDLLDAMATVPAPRFTRFCDAFGLLPFERDVLLLSFAHAVSTEIARRCAAMPESVNGCPTFALALGLAADPGWDALADDARDGLARRAAVPAWDALGPGRPLRSWRLLEITQPGGQALVSSPLRADERIVNHLMGHDHLDDRISPLCRPVLRGEHRGRLSATQCAVVDEALNVLGPMARRRGTQLVQLPGGDGPTKRLYAVHLAAGLGLVLHRVLLEDVSRPDTAQAFVRLWNRERHLQPVALHLDANSLTPETGGALRRLLEDLDGLVLLDAAEPVPGQDTALVLDVARPASLEQRDGWLEVLGAGQQEWVDRLTGQFDLNLDEITETAENPDCDGRRPTGERLWARHRSRGRARLEGLAQRVVPTTTLEQVQLPGEETRMLYRLRDQARHRATVYDRYGFRARLPRGLGITALFAGESGTGKSMAAEALACALDVDLYRIDLASVVSKYIGETEKNLKRVFDAAEQSGAVLLFDEADAIFGKRSEVRDSHDRYANIEVSYLLQRMEAYVGLAVLTTNLKSSLDTAFLRRLRSVITFPFPGTEQRRAIWAGVFPEGLPGVRDLDLDVLAVPGLTGGQIRNVAVDAAFRAAAGDGVITMDRLREAARDESRKHGTPFAAADFAAWRSRELIGMEAMS